MLILSSTCLSTESWLSSCLMQAIMLGTEDAEHQHFFIVAMATLAQVWERCLSMKKKKKERNLWETVPWDLLTYSFRKHSFHPSVWKWEIMNHWESTIGCWIRGKEKRLAIRSSCFLWENQRKKKAGVQMQLKKQGKILGQGYWGLVCCCCFNDIMWYGKQCPNLNATHLFIAHRSLNWGLFGVVCWGQT